MQIPQFPRDEFIRSERLAQSPVPPMHWCKRRHVTGESYIFTDRLMEHEVINELRRVSGDNGFELIYDRATTTDCALPGHHVYRVVQRAGVPSEDVMLFEFSCVHDHTKPWSPENARKPGWWIIDYFKSRDKARMDPEAVRAINSGQDVVDRHKDLLRRKDRESTEKAREFGRAVDTFARKKRGGDKFVGKLLRQQKKKQAAETEQPIQVAVK